MIPNSQAASRRWLTAWKLVRKLPEPIRKVIGDLSNVERTLVGLQLRPAKA